MVSSLVMKSFCRNRTFPTRRHEGVARRPNLGIDLGARGFSSGAVAGAPAVPVPFEGLVLQEGAEVSCDDKLGCEGGESVGCEGQVGFSGGEGGFPEGFVISGGLDADGSVCVMEAEDDEAGVGGAVVFLRGDVNVTGDEVPLGAEFLYPFGQEGGAAPWG